MRALAWVALVLVVSGCSREAPLSAEAERGRRVYQAQCIACHNPDPAQSGAVGPAIKGASLDLLRAKVLEGRYPAGYTPKRPTKVMQPLPQLAQDLSAVAEFLR